MKAKDLMIGDWLNTSQGIAKVIAIDKIGLTFMIDGGDFDIDSYDEEEWFETIPLTSEILKKNGFERFSTDYILCGQPFRLSNPSTPDNYKDNYWLKVSEQAVNIKYVHELQHALRLCGIENEIEL